MTRTEVFIEFAKTQMSYKFLFWFVIVWFGFGFLSHWPIVEILIRAVIFLLFYTFIRFLQYSNGKQIEQSIQTQTEDDKST